MTPTFVLATHSGNKVREIREILGGPAARAVVSLAELGVEPDPAEDAVEAFETFRENAIAKARFFVRRTGRPTIAEDSGIVVPVLGGEPGARSKRFAAASGLEGIELDQANNRLLLERLRDVPPEARAAYYVCAAAVVHPDAPDRARVFIGTCSGRIAEAPRGTGGFGYDPLFEVPGLDATFAELPAAEKHRRSHRARAFRALAASLFGAHPGP